MVDQLPVGDEGGSVLIPPPVSIDPAPALRWYTASEIGSTVPAEPEWLIKPYVAIGVVTDLTSKIKHGKTRLILDGVAAMLQGLPFLGSPTKRTSIVYLTEENAISFRQALTRAGLLERVDVHILFRYDARGLPWHELVQLAIHKCRETGAQLLIVDTLADWAGLKNDEENSSGSALEAMQPLRDAAAGGLAVVILRHDRKVGGPVGDSARGSSSFGGAADILLSLRLADGKERTSRRHLACVGRFDAPALLTLDIRDGHYVALGEGRDAVVNDAAARIERLLGTNESVLFIKDLAEELLGVSKTTLKRAVALLVEQGKVERVPDQGKTKKAVGYRGRK